MWTNKVLSYKSWRKHLWYLWGDGKVLKLANRNAAIMWLKHYGKPGTSYMLDKRRGMHTTVRTVRVENGYVYFYNPDYGMISAESKRTHPYAIRNN